MDTKTKINALDDVVKTEIDAKVEPKFKQMKLPEFKEFMQAGVQFGHQTNKWNPKMKRYIHGSKNGIHIVDLNQTLKLLSQALSFLQESAFKGSVLMVGTKFQVIETLKEEAVRAGANFVNMRWPGGLLTNFKQVKVSLKRLNELEQMFEEGIAGRTKQEISWLKAEWQRLNRLYSGVKSMTTLPSAIFIVDPKFERNAIREAKIVGIPVVALADTNADPTKIDYIIPGNDDAERSLKLMLKLVSDAIRDGNQGAGVKHVFKDYAKMDVIKK